MTGEECTRELSRMSVSEGVGVNIPATKAEIETTNASSVIIYDDHLRKIAH